MTPADLKQLIADLETQEPSRELADRVLKVAIHAWHQKWPAAGKLHAPGQHWYRWDTEIVLYQDRPNPLSSVDDAMLMVPEGWRIAELRDTDPTLKHMLACVTLHPYNGNDKGWKIGPMQSPLIDDLVRALTLAALKARLAEMEHE